MWWSSAAVPWTGRSRPVAVPSPPTGPLARVDTCWIAFSEAESGSGGDDRNRTGVTGFADPRLTTRPRRRIVDLSGRRDSNPRPQPWQGCALPTELLPRRWAHCSARVTPTKRSYLPVDPNPPAPRTVSSRLSTSIHSIAGTGTIASWAMRSPRANSTVSSPWLINRALISPR